MWTYKFDRIDPTVTKDSNTPGRFTFKRYLYFEPDIYDTWRVNAPLSSIPYSAEIISQLPALKTRLSGELSSFYLYDYEEISNLNKEDNPQATSYGVATLLYENYPSNDGGGSGSGNDDERDDASSDPKYEPETGDIMVWPPWEAAVNDFSVTTYTYERPWISGYVQPAPSGQSFLTEAVQNAAKQGYKGLNVTTYGYKYTWTYNTNDKNEDYTSEFPVINSNDFEIGNTGVTVGAFHGLLMPPTLKVVFYNDKESRESFVYYQWHFEMLQVFEENGQGNELFNAGTRAYFDIGDPPSSVIKDICSWYVAVPSGTTPIQRQYGYFDQMVQAKKEVEEFNKTVSDNLQKKQFIGDFVKDQVPLTPNGYIDYSAINGITPKDTITFWKYPFVEFREGLTFGWRNDPSAEWEN